MTVPKELPLDDGKVSCRTCHEPGADGAVDRSRSGSAPIRGGSAGALCVKCHPEAYGDPAGARHPVQLEDAPPDARAGDGSAAPAPDVPNAITCRTCHRAHGAGPVALLVREPGGNALCLNCHSAKAPHADGPGRAHPLSGALSAARRDAIGRMGSHAAPDGTLSCISCHRLHDGGGGRDLLARTLEDGALCAACHSEKTSLIGSAHDLRVTAAGERNAFRETAAEGGPCGACHGVHGEARRGIVGPADPDGSCLTCHSVGQCAEDKAIHGLGHPINVGADRLAKLIRRTRPARRSARDEPARGSLECADCHDPHGGSSGASNLLRSIGGGTRALSCASCHAQVAPLARSLHVGMNGGNLAPGNVSCRPCHSVHAGGGGSGTARRFLWAGPTGAPRRSPLTQYCTGCHSAVVLPGPPGGFIHPAIPMANRVPEDDPSYMPLVSAAGEVGSSGLLTCITCHLPHGRPPDDGVEPPPPDDAVLLAATMPMVRAYVPPNPCSDCHGFDGLRRFLYFHDAARRDRSEPLNP